MDLRMQFPRGLILAVLVTVLATPARATMMVRASLGELTAASRLVVVGEVVDSHSYWNRDSNFILTDVRVAVAEVLKGRTAGRELTLTLLGGTVGEQTTAIIGGPELHLGRAYVLFLDRAHLPGAPRSLSVRELSQGAFDLVADQGGLRAVSQARLHLIPDRAGEIEPPGGRRGLPLEALKTSVRELAKTPEVK